ncbi:UNVERIFIED_CONTAM: hypothetical protein HDU68_012276 [Siphonaria sp. JEL0065]|nr:hypothetical protein HDU68_012276 [Siphonaria sp. JEL0065]
MASRTTFVTLAPAKSRPSSLDPPARKRISQSAEALNTLISSLTTELEKAEISLNADFEPLDPHLTVTYEESLSVSTLSGPLKKVDSITHSSWKPTTLVYIKNPPYPAVGPLLLLFKTASPFPKSHPIASLKLAHATSFFHERLGCEVVRVVGRGMCSDGAVHKKVWTFKGMKGEEGVVEGWVVGLGGRIVGKVGGVEVGGRDDDDAETEVDVDDERHGEVEVRGSEDGEYVELVDRGSFEGDVGQEGGVPALVLSSRPKRSSSLSRRSNGSGGSNASVVSSPNVSPPQLFMDAEENQEAYIYALPKNHLPVDVIPKRRSSLKASLEYARRSG